MGHDATSDVREKATKNGSIYIRAKRGMYGLPQAGLMANELLEKQNNLLIQKDLLENEMVNLKSAIENEKNTKITLINRLNELQSKKLP